MINVLGICGSPVTESNTELMLNHALDAIQGDDVQCETITLSSRTINGCRQCNWCMFKQSPGNYCSLTDDMTDIYPRIIEADALLVASPVYLGRLSGQTAQFLDRLRSIHYGNENPGGLKYKVGAGLAAGWYRNSGIETTLTSIHWAFLTFQMLIATPGSMSTFGGACHTSLSGTGACDPKDKHQVLKDEYGLETARSTALSLVELTRIIKAGKTG